MVLQVDDVWFDDKFITAVIFSDTFTPQQSVINYNINIWHS